MGSFPPSSRRTRTGSGGLSSCESSRPIEVPPSSRGRPPTTTLPTLRTDEALPARDKHGVLLITTGLDAGRLVAITDNVLITIGRSHECVVKIDDELLSRVHARVACVHGRYVLADARSTNGTYRNGERLTSTVELEDGDRLVLGRTTSVWFKVVDDAEEKSLALAYEGASRDGLTGMFNRRYLDAALDAEVALAVRKRLPLSLIMLDVDHFKRINDGWGHMAGDESLRRLAAIIAHGIRTSDIAARFGGEEFVVIARVTSLAEAATLAERLRKAVERRPMCWDNAVRTLTISAGVAALSCCAAEPSVSRLLEIADQRLLEAKRHRNCVVAQSDTAAR